MVRSVAAAAWDAAAEMQRDIDMGRGDVGSSMEEPSDTIPIGDDVRTMDDYGLGRPGGCVPKLSMSLTDPREATFYGNGLGYFVKTIQDVSELVFPHGHMDDVLRTMRVDGKGVDMTVDRGMTLSTVRCDGKGVDTAVSDGRVLRLGVEMPARVTYMQPVPQWELLYTVSARSGAGAAIDMHGLVRNNEPEDWVFDSLVLTSDKPYRARAPSTTMILSKGPTTRALSMHAEVAEGPAPSDPGVLKGIHRYPVGAWRIPKGSTLRVLLDTMSAEMEPWAVWGGHRVDRALKLKPTESVGMSGRAVVLLDGAYSGEARIRSMRKGRSLWLHYAPDPMCRVAYRREEGEPVRLRNGDSLVNITYTYDVECPEGRRIRIKHRIRDTAREERPVIVGAGATRIKAKLYGKEFRIDVLASAESFTLTVHEFYVIVKLT